MRGEKNLDTSVLMELYGDMLTKKQLSMMDMYFNLDYSLSEIAENSGISRQGALDNIKHGEAKLKKFETALGIMRKYTATEHELDQMEEELSGASEELRGKIMRRISNIRALWED